MTTAPSSTAAENAPPVRVLTQLVLLHHVTGFLSGFPQLVFEFQRDIVPACSHRRPMSHDIFKRMGLWPHAAIATNNQ